MHRNKPVPLLPVVLALVALAPAVHAQIIGGSNILTNADVATLSGYLGEGPLELTRIFSHVNGGDTLGTLDFHAAVDGKGRTFSLAKVISFNAGTSLLPNAIIGGYDPLSWDSSGAYHFSNTDAERTAFVFNLTEDLKQMQNTTSQLTNGQDIGLYQTFNDPGAGPRFGNSGDFFVGSGMNIGFAQHESYGGTNGVPDILGNLSGPGISDGLTYSNVEVFTIAPASATPEPGSLALLVGLVTSGAGFLARRRHNARRSV